MNSDYYVHDLSESLFTIGKFSLRYYSLSYLFGLLLGMWLLKSLANKRRIGLTSMQVTDMIIPYALFGVLVGGRLGYVLFYDLKGSLENPAEILKIWKGGMASHGGILGVCIALWIFARRRRVPFLHVLDLAALVAPIGLGLGRIANFINGELWGRPATVPWAVIFPKGGEFPRHPSQLYEALAEGLLLFLLLWLFHRKLLPKTGALSAVFAFGYSVGRIVCEQFREPDGHIGFHEWLGLEVTRGQILTTLVILAGVGLSIAIAMGKTPKWKVPEEPVEAESAS